MDRTQLCGRKFQVNNTNIFVWKGFFDIITSIMSRNVVSIIIILDIVLAKAGGGF